MKDPLRITETNPGELDGNLIVSMQNDRPSRGARDRTIAALDIGSAALSASTSTTAALAGKGAVAGTIVALGKWIALGVGTGGLAMGLLYRASQPPHVSAPAARPPIEVASPIEPWPSATVPAPSSSPSLPQLIKSASPRAPQRDLAGEVTLLDRARTATRAGDPVHALELLGSYSKRFPRGALTPEATLLRVDALAASGQKSEAMALAREALMASPTSPHAERLQSMAAGDFAP